MGALISSSAFCADDMYAISGIDARQQEATTAKNNKIQFWRLKLTSFFYAVTYRPGEESVFADALSLAFCATANAFDIREDHNNLFHPGIGRITHFVHSENLPYSVEDV